VDIPLDVVLIAGALFIVLLIAAYAVAARAGKAGRTPYREGRKPDWMRTTPPKETIAAAQADGEGISLYRREAGEKIASPFAEQVEDIVQARLKTIPELASVHIDFGTLPDGGLEISVDGTSYEDIRQIPDERLRRVIREAVESWDQGK